MSVLTVVVPCYNEEEVLPETVRRLTDKLARMVAAGKCDPRSRILFVDDGSRDRTWELIAAYHAEMPTVCGLKLAHNRGHQHALLAGLMAAREFSDCTISMDADLQDDIEVLDDFMDAHAAGADVVYGVRKKRDKDTFFKRTTAQGFYKLMKALGVETVYNHADYRLMSRPVLDALSEYREVNLFLRGIVPDIGFSSAIVYYDRGDRFAGESKYPLKKMLSFALDGITSFSVKPLKLITRLGGLIAVLSLLALIYALVAVLAGLPGAGPTALVASIWLLGGLQMVCMGIVGGYVGKIYAESKHRPRYIVEKLLTK